MAEAVLDGHQQPAKLFALLVVKPDEQRILGRALGVCGPREMTPPGLGEGDEVTATVAGVALTRDETVGLQRIEHRHQDAGISPGHLRQLRLARRPVVVQQPEQVKLPRREMLAGMRIA